MAFLKRLFGKGEKPKAESPAVDPMRGHETLQTEAEQDATRSRMEADMDRQREQRAPAPAEKPEDNAENK